MQSLSSFPPIVKGGWRRSCWNVVTIKFVMVFSYSRVQILCLAGLRIRSLVFLANRSYFEKKKYWITLSLFLKVRIVFSKRSALGALYKKAICSFKKSDSLSFVFIKAKPKSVIYIFRFSFLFKKKESPLLKRANRFFIKSESLLCSKKLRRANRSFCSSRSFKKSDKSNRANSQPWRLSVHHCTEQYFVQPVGCYFYIDEQSQLVHLPQADWI